MKRGSNHLVRYRFSSTCVRMNPFTFLLALLLLLLVVVPFCFCSSVDLSSSSRTCVQFDNSSSFIHNYTYTPVPLSSSSSSITDLSFLFRLHTLVDPSLFLVSLSTLPSSSSFFSSSSYSDSPFVSALSFSFNSSLTHSIPVWSFNISYVGPPFTSNASYFSHACVDIDESLSCEMDQICSSSSSSSSSSSLTYLISSSSLNNHVNPYTASTDVSILFATSPIISSSTSSLLCAYVSVSNSSSRPSPSSSPCHSHSYVASLCGGGRLLLPTWLFTTLHGSNSVITNTIYIYLSDSDDYFYSVDLMNGNSLTPSSSSSSNVSSIPFFVSSSLINVDLDVQLFHVSFPNVSSSSSSSHPVTRYFVYHFSSQFSDASVTYSCHVNASSNSSSPPVTFTSLVYLSLHTAKPNVNTSNVLIFNSSQTIFLSSDRLNSTASLWFTHLISASSSSSPVQCDIRVIEYSPLPFNQSFSLPSSSSLSSSSSSSSSSFTNWCNNSTSSSPSSLFLQSLLSQPKYFRVTQPISTATASSSSPPSFSSFASSFVSYSFNHSYSTIFELTHSVPDSQALCITVGINESVNTSSSSSSFSFSSCNGTLISLTNGVATYLVQLTLNCSDDFMLSHLAISFNKNASSSSLLLNLDSYHSHFSLRVSQPFAPSSSTPLPPPPDPTPDPTNKQVDSGVPSSIKIVVIVSGAIVILLIFVAMFWCVRRYCLTRTRSSSLSYYHRDSGVLESHSYDTHSTRRSASERLKRCLLNEDEKENDGGASGETIGRTSSSANNNANNTIALQLSARRPSASSIAMIETGTNGETGSGANKNRNNSSYAYVESDADGI